MKERQVFLIRNVENLLITLKGNEYFNTINLCDLYYQVHDYEILHKIDQYYLKRILFKRISTPGNSKS